jgi:hypothetical protein
MYKDKIDKLVDLTLQDFYMFCKIRATSSKTDPSKVLNVVNN